MAQRGLLAAQQGSLEDMALLLARQELLNRADSGLKKVPAIPHTCFLKMPFLLSALSKRTFCDDGNLPVQANIVTVSHTCNMATITEELYFNFN